MIKTKKIRLTPRKLLNILIVSFAKKHWWFYSLMWLLAIAMLVIDHYDAYTYWYLGFTIAFPILLVVQLWRYVNLKRNKLILAERFYEIDNEKISSMFDEDTFSSIKLEYFIKVVFVCDSYLLYVASNQFVLIPIDSFESDDDRRWFEDEIVMKIKSKAR
jgi:hypothetical protein